jgi:hypothetical protein
VSDFPAGQYKTIILSNLTGIIDGILSPTGNHVVVGTSGSNQVYLI